MTIQSAPARAALPDRLLEKAAIRRDVPELREEVEERDPPPRGAGGLMRLENPQVVVGGREEGRSSRQVEDRRNARVPRRHGVEEEQPVVLHPPAPEDPLPGRDVELELVPDRDEGGCRSR